MARNVEIDITSRRETLDQFIGAYVEYGAREPIPKWWREFEAFYEEFRGKTITVRTENGPIGGD